MKKQFKKIIAILLSFYVFFFVFVNAFALVTLDVYYSESMTIGRWSTTPFIYHQKLSSNESFPFVQGLVHGIQQWNPTLGIFVTTTTLNTNAPIKFYGGTYNNLLNTGHTYIFIIM